MRCDRTAPHNAAPAVNNLPNLPNLPVGWLLVSREQGTNPGIERSPSAEGRLGRLGTYFPPTSPRSVADDHAPQDGMVMLLPGLLDANRRRAEALVRMLRERLRHLHRRPGIFARQRVGQRHQQPLLLHALTLLLLQCAHDHSDGEGALLRPRVPQRLKERLPLARFLGGTVVDLGAVAEQALDTGEGEHTRAHLGPLLEAAHRCRVLRQRAAGLEPATYDGQ